jgi:hypothetical protein
MEARSPVPFCVAVALSVAACAGSAGPTPEPSASTGGSTIAHDYLGGGPPARAQAQPPADGAEGPHEFNPAERWIAEHLPWVAPWVGR